MPLPEVFDVPRSELNDVVEVLAQAFRDYAVMRYVLEGRVPDTKSGGVGLETSATYEADLRRLIRLFTETRYVRGGLVWALRSDGELVAAANIDRPQVERGESTTVESELAALREAAWRELGEEARERYEDYGEVSATFEWPEPHYHLGMIGVPSHHQGAGYARLLLDALHRVADATAESRGCSLTTEVERNLSLYEYFGYRVIGHGKKGGLASWGLFRESSA